MFTIGYITIEENIRLRREIRSYEDIYKLRYFINQVIINELKMHYDTQKTPSEIMRWS